MQRAKSFVITPDSTVSMQTSSNFLQKTIRSLLLSNLPLNSKPLVHAKIEAIGLVEVFFPRC